MRRVSLRHVTERRRTWVLLNELSNEKVICKRSRGFIWIGWEQRRVRLDYMITVWFRRGRGGGNSLTRYLNGTPPRSITTACDLIDFKYGVAVEELTVRRGMRRKPGEEAGRLMSGVLCWGTLLFSKTVHSRSLILRSYPWTSLNTLLEVYFLALVYCHLGFITIWCFIFSSGSGYKGVLSVSCAFVVSYEGRRCGLFASAGTAILQISSSRG